MQSCVMQHLGPSPADPVGTLQEAQQHYLQVTSTYRIDEIIEKICRNS